MLADDAEVVGSPFYTEWAQPQDLFHHLFGIVDIDGNVVTLLMMARSKDKGAFWDDDAVLMGRLLPHLRQGLRAGVVLRRAQEMGRVHAHALDVLPIGVIVVSAIGRVLFANRLARDVLATEPAFTPATAAWGSSWRRDASCSATCSPPQLSAPPRT